MRGSARARVEPGLPNPPCKYHKHSFEEGTEAHLTPDLDQDVRPCQNPRLYQRMEARVQAKAHIELLTPPDVVFWRFERSPRSSAISPLRLPHAYPEMSRVAGQPARNSARNMLNTARFGVDWPSIIAGYGRWDGLRRHEKARVTPFPSRHFPR